MRPNNETLVLIPARGGSKGIPRKNILKLAGLPLIGYTIRAALKAAIGRVVVSTDDEEIAEVSTTFGAEVPFLRPQHLASDTSTGLDVVLHAIDQLGVPCEHTNICILQPTSPLRSTEDITGALELFHETGDAVVGVTEATKPLSWHHQITHNQRLIPTSSSIENRRQDAEPLVIPNGAIYISSLGSIRKNQSFFPPNTRAWLMPAERSIDIDDELDWILAEAILTGMLGEIRRRLSPTQTQS